MRQTTSTVLFGVVALIGVSSGSTPRGVGPEFIHFYESKDAFTCIGAPSIKLSLSQVNDNSCDCPDGSDEPGTAACAHLDPLSPPQPFPESVTGTSNTSNALPGFWCVNAGHIGSYIPFMYVNDGVCDHELCCDGSDEYAGAGGVKCKNRCAEIGKEWRRQEEERLKSLERSAKKRKTLKKEAREAKRRLQAKITSLKVEVSMLDKKVQNLQQKLEDVERQEAGKVVKSEPVGGRLGVLLSQAKERVQLLRDAANQIITQRTHLRTKVEDLELILKNLKEEYNPNYNDEGVKKALKLWEEYSERLQNEVYTKIPDEDMDRVLEEDSETHGINWKEFEFDDTTDTDILYKLEAYLPAPLRDFVHNQLDSLRIWLIQNGVLADNPRSGTESVLVKAARDALGAANLEVSNKRTELMNSEDDMTRDYGPDDIFRALKGKCISTESGEYEYEVCWFDKATQKNKGGHGGTSLGNFVELVSEMSEEEEREDGKGLGTGKRMVLKFDNGQSCWNGPQRRTDVWLACSENEELWRVSEAEKCVYKMEIGTPAACDPLVEAPKAKEEL